MNRRTRLLAVLVGAALLVLGPLAQADVIGYWKLDSNVNDSSGGGHNGSYAGTGHAFDTGRLGDALELNGNGYVTIADDPVWDTGNAVSVSNWFRTTTAQGGIGFLVHDNGSAYKYLNYLTSNSTNVSFYVRTDFSGVTAVSVGGDWKDDQWHHLVGVFDRSAPAAERVQIYIDGVRKTTTGPDEPIAAGNDGLRIGAWNTPYTGLIDDVAVFDHPLSADEVAYLWNGGTGHTVNTAVAWNAAAAAWSDADNWNPKRVPYATDIVHVRNGGTAELSDDRKCTKLAIAYDDADTGTVEMTGGSLTGMSDYWGLSIGESGGTGEFRQNGGTVSMSQRLLLAGTGGSGVYRLSDGTLTVPLTTYIGSRGTGEVIQTGGTADLSGTVHMGVWSLAGHGIYRISGDATLNAGYLMVSHNGPAEFYQTGGTVNVATDVLLGYGNTGLGSGLYEISGGTLDVDGSLIVGRNAPGTFHIIGDDATILVDGYTQTAASTLDLDINGISPITVDGLVSLAGGLDIEFLTAPLAGQWFPILLNDLDEAVSGTFSGKDEGAMFLAPGSDLALRITYAGNFDGGEIGNDVGILVTPEPATLTLLALGGLGLVARRRKQR